MHPPMHLDDPERRAAEPSRGFPRAPGLPVLIALIAVGMGVPAYFQWMVPRLEVRRDRILAGAPSEPHGQLERWFEFGKPQIFEALVASRFSARQPWLVSHAILPANPGEPPEVWGIDFSQLARDVIRLDGLVVRVELPAPALLAREPLFGDNALGVRKYVPGVELPDPRQFAKERLEFVLERLARGLARDIRGARLSIEIGGLKDPEPPKQPPEEESASKG